MSSLAVVQRLGRQKKVLVAQWSATPATVAATPPCSATPFQTQISVRHLPAQGGERCDTKLFRGCSATGSTRNRVQLSCKVGIFLVAQYTSLEYTDATTHARCSQRT